MSEYDIGLKQKARKNVLTTEETCLLLHRTRQQLNNIIKSGGLEVFKSTPKANLFWRSDVYALLKKLNKETPRSYTKIYGSSTESAKKAFRELSINKDDVEQVYVFFEEWDAIQKNFYNVEGIEMPDTLTRLDAPRFIIIMKDGTEYWFNGLTCGYSGTGTAGTEEVLEELGIDKAVGNRAHPRISAYKICHYYRSGSKWEFDGENPEDSRAYWSIREKNLLGLETQLYRYNGHLVLTQGARYITSPLDDGLQEPSLRMLANSLYFTPNPTEVQFLSREDALATGHYDMAFSETLVYQIVIRDFNENELWLTYPFETIKPEKQQSMRDLMRMLNVKLDEETLSDKVISWLGKKPRFKTTTYTVHEADWRGPCGYNGDIKK